MTNIPNILVINLDDRPKRWAEVKESFKGWPNLERVSAVKESPGWKGCAKSHVKCLKIAKDRGYPWVLVLEDDCEVKPDSFGRFHELLPVLWSKRAEWDVFLGGCTQINIIRQVERSPPIFKVQGQTTHFCLYNSNVYDTIIGQYEVIGDTNTLQIDLYYKKYLRLFCTTPHLALQRPGTSDIEDEDVDYRKYFMNAEAILKHYMESQLVLEGFSISDQRLTVNFIIASVALVILLTCMNQRRRR